LRITNIG
jgi:cytoskeletal protein CcmA (bactofilin family)